MTTKDTEKQPEGNGPKSPAPPLPNEDQRVAAERERMLKEQASNAVGEANAAKSRVAALEGEIKKKDEELDALRKANEALEGKVAGLAVAVNRSGLPVLQVKLPDTARQLRESVTIAAGVKDKTRTGAKAGDVVVLEPTEKQLEKLQRDLGVSAIAHAVGPEQMKDLEESGFLA